MIGFFRDQDHLGFKIKNLEVKIKFSHDHVFVQDRSKLILREKLILGVDHGPGTPYTGYLGSNDQILGPPTAHACNGLLRDRLTPGCPRCDEIVAGAPIRRWGIARV